MAELGLEVFDRTVHDTNNWRARPLSLEATRNPVDPPCYLRKAHLGRAEGLNSSGIGLKYHLTFQNRFQSRGPALVYGRIEE